MNIKGIPDRNISTLPPEAFGVIWDYVIHRHEADKAGLHYDLRLSPPGSDVAYSWAIPKAKLPGPYEKILAVKQADHSREYMSWTGTIEDGYGKGKVTIAEKGQVEILSSSPTKITFNIYGGYESNRYNLINTSGDNWLLLNYTPTKEVRNIPDYKPKYKDIDIKKLKFDIDSEVFAPKFDGAHAVVHLRKGHNIDTFSYRPSKRSNTKLIDHTFKTKLYRIKQNRYKDTVLRGELLGRDSKGNPLPVTTTGGILNSSVPNSRKQQEEKGQLDFVAFDLVRYNGVNVEKIPYSEKLEKLKEISLNIPEIKIPKLYKTKEEKERLYSDILTGKSKDTDEGIIIYKTDQSDPSRAKIKNDFDVYVTGIFEGTGKYLGKAAGGFTYSLTFGGPTVGKVGSGFDDATRIDMWKNQKKYIGMAAKVVTERKYHTGSLRLPIFKEWRIEKFPKYAEETKLPLATMKIYKDGKPMGLKPIYKIVSNEPIDVGRWTDTLHTRGHRGGYLKMAKLLLPKKPPTLSGMTREVRDIVSMFKKDPKKSFLYKEPIQLKHTNENAMALHHLRNSPSNEERLIAEAIKLTKVAKLGIGKYGFKVPFSLKFKDVAKAVGTKPPMTPSVDKATSFTKNIMSNIKPLKLPTGGTPNPANANKIWPMK